MGNDFDLIARALEAAGDTMCGAESKPLDVGVGVDGEQMIIFHCNLPAGHDGDEHEISIRWPRD